MPPENLIFKTQYFHNKEEWNAFKAFIINIHNLDFSEWETAGYRDDAYRPFSFFQGGDVISSMCIYSLDAVINGENTRLAQISGVGTLPEWRRKGLGKRLNDIALEWANGAYSGFFLFADTDAIPFYKACGFSPVEVYLEYVEASATPKAEGAIKLNPADHSDLEKIYHYARQRAPISDKFSILNEYLFMFHVLYNLRDKIVEIPNLDCIVCYEREKECLKIYDIVGKSIPKLSEIYPYLADETDKIIEFHFHTDKLGCNNLKTKPIKWSNVFVKNVFPVKRPVFPYTSKA